METHKRTNLPNYMCDCKRYCDRKRCREQLIARTVRFFRAQLVAIPRMNESVALELDTAIGGTLWHCARSLYGTMYVYGMYSPHALMNRKLHFNSLSLKCKTLKLVSVLHATPYLFTSASCVGDAVIAVFRQ